MSEIKDQEHLPHSFSSDLEIMNYLGKKSIPFLFILDFTLKAPVIIPLQSLGETGILYDMEGKRNFQKKAFSIRNNLNFVKYPVTYETYRKAFTIIRNHLVRGDSYLVNLTFPTRVETSFSLLSLPGWKLHLVCLRYFTVPGPGSSYWFRDGLLFFLQNCLSE